MRRAAKWIGGILAVLVAMPILLTLAANTGPGRSAIVWSVPRLTGDTIRLAGLSGRIPDALRIARIELRDPHGDYATIHDLVLDWSPLQLLHRRIVIDHLSASNVNALRLPTGSSGGTGLPVAVILREIRVARLDIDASLAGAPVTVALEGSGQFTSPTDVSGTVHIRRLNNAGSYAVSGDVDAARLHARLQIDEPAHGVLANLAGLPNLGALTLDATLDGPRQAVNTRLAFAAGDLHATVGGTLDLERNVADLMVSAGAPAMRPRADIGWQVVSIDAHVRGPFARPDAAGRLRVDELTAAGVSIGRLSADIAGNMGQLRLDGEVTGLRIPGPNANLLAGAPLVIKANARLDVPDRPVHVVLRHPLFTIDATALTGDHRRLDASLRAVNLEPLAALGQVQMQGGLALNLHAATDGGTTTLAADGTLGITGGQPQATALIGENGRFSLAATVRGNDITLSRLQFAGRAATAEASGHAADNSINLSWSLNVNDLSAAAPQLAGQLQATGSVNGTTDNLTFAADINGGVSTQGMASGPLTARVEARGLPNNPSGSITARGDLLDAPVDLAVALHRDSSGFAIDIERAVWKSLQAGGSIHLATATMLPTGDLHLAMTRLADLTPLFKRPVSGAVNVHLIAPADTSHPTLDAQVDAERVQVGGIGGNLHGSAHGTIDALDVKLDAALPDLHGAPAQLDAAATIDAVHRTATVGSLRADWRHQEVRLLAPARISFADGIAIDSLRLGLREAVLAVSGRVGAVLDLTASLRNLSADLVGADGSVMADARITGTAARPVGKLRLAASGLRMRSGPGRAMPPASITANVELAGTEARIDARVIADRSHVSLNGRAPLSAAGALDLRAGGSVDLGLLDPVLAAGGRRVRGHLTMDCTITGTVAAPNIAGSARLATGEVQDYSSGLHLSDIAAQVTGSGDSLRIAQFSAKAGQGSIVATGSIGVRAPGLPVNLSITARDAQPLASDLITAVIDASLELRGEALGQLTASGSVQVRRAEFRLPDRMPAAIAVLPVRQPGAKAAPPATTATAVALNVALSAPRQVFIRGRGIDVELGGAMQLGGTLAAPRTEGSLSLRRGSISLAGRSLDFTEGRISFTGGGITDPALHLVADSVSNDVTATLTIGGTAHQPKITLSSVPALPQDEVLAHLLFGSGTGRLGPLELAGIASSLATLTGAGGIGDPLDKVRQGLGLDRLSVQNSANGSPALEAGRYIAPRVYLGAKQSASGGTQATVQVDITKGLKLEATAGTGTGSATGSAADSNGSSVGLTYRFEY